MSQLVNLYAEVRPAAAGERGDETKIGSLPGVLFGECLTLSVCAFVVVVVLHGCHCTCLHAYSQACAPGPHAHTRTYVHCLRARPHTCTQVHMDFGAPLSPFQQLLAVLPAASAPLLPPCIGALMTGELKVRPSRHPPPTHPILPQMTYTFAPRMYVHTHTHSKHKRTGFHVCGQSIFGAAVAPSTPLSVVHIALIGMRCGGHTPTRRSAPTRSALTQYNILQLYIYIFIYLYIYIYIYIYI